MTLGYITEEDAARALERANEDPERVLRVKAMVEAEDGPPIDLLGTLLEHDPVAEELFGPDYRDYTFERFAEEVFGPIRATEVKDTTWENEQYRLGVLYRGIGTVKMRDLNAARWAKYLASRSGVSPRTRKLQQDLYTRVLEVAKFHGAIDEIHDFRPIRGWSKRTRPIEPLTEDEVQALLAHARPVFRAIIGLGVGQGLRPSEIVGQRWEDIRWDAGTMFVSGGSKTDGSATTIVLTPIAEQELRRWWEHQGKPTTGHVIVAEFGPQAGKPIGRFHTGLHELAKRAGIRGPEQGRRIFPYLLRHSFATWAAGSGVPIAVAQAIMRHTTSKMLLEVYAKVGTDQIRQGLDRFPTLS